MSVEVYTVQEVALAMKVTPQTIRAWIKAGKLQGKLVGKTYVISKEALLGYIDKYEKKNGG